MNPSAPHGDSDLAAPSTGVDPDRYVADARHADAAHARRRDRWRRARIAESTTLRGALASLVGLQVELHLASGSTTRGTVDRVGVDFVELLATGGSQWFSLSAVLSFEASDSFGAEVDEHLELSLFDLLEQLGEQRDPVVVTIRSGTVVAGDVVTVGEMLIVVDPTTARRGAVPLDAIESVRSR